MKEQATAIDRAQVVRAFTLWAKEGQTLALPDPDSFRLVTDAIEELIELKTYKFDEWFIRNHYRYVALRELDRRRARELGRRFIAQLQLGKVEL